MKIRFTLFLITFGILFSACHQNVKTIPEKEKQQEVSKDSVSQKVNSHESEPVKKVDLTSKLAEKVARLAQLKYNYQLKSLDLVSPKKSMLLGGFLYVLPLRDTVTNDLDTLVFKKHLHQIRKSFLKGTKPMQPNGHTYPRVTVEEYIFKTPENAKISYNMLEKSDADAGLWMYISKSPYEFFLEENRIYFMSSGGYYMMEIYKDIFEEIKD